jgi:hypothetical protein
MQALNESRQNMFRASVKRLTKLEDIYGIVPLKFVALASVGVQLHRLYTNSPRYATVYNPHRICSLFCLQNTALLHAEQNETSSLQSLGFHVSKDLDVHVDLFLDVWCVYQRTRYHNADDRNPKQRFSSFKFIAKYFLLNNKSAKAFRVILYLFIKSNVQDINVLISHIPIKMDSNSNFYKRKTIKQGCLSYQNLEKQVISNRCKQETSNTFRITEFLDFFHLRYSG